MPFLRDSQFKMGIFAAQGLRRWALLLSALRAWSEEPVPLIRLARIDHSCAGCDTNARLGTTAKMPYGS